MHAMKEAGEMAALTQSSVIEEDYFVWKRRVEGPDGRLTRMMILLNTLGFVAHLAAIVVAVVVSGERISMKLSISRWNVVIKSESLTAVNSTDIWDNELVHAFYLPIGWCVVGVHCISCFFHAFIAFMLIASRWLPWTSTFYLKGLYLCRAPWRWIEYSLSATLMIFITVVLMGVREITSIVSISSLCFVTQLFGWLTEVHSSGLIDRTQTVRDRKAFFGKCGTRYDFSYSWKNNTLIDRLGWHHLAGYIPFLTMWALIFYTFYLYRNGLGELYPEFMDYIIWGSMAFFTLFGVTQFLQQFDDFGPSWYPIGEASYVALSFLAKVWLGVIITYQLLAEGAQFDGVVGAQF